MDISDIIVFNRVASSLSFVQAARQIGSSRSMVSKRITRLEKSLGVRLISRNPRKSCLTEAGRRFYERTAEIDRLIEEAFDDVRMSHFEPNGTIKFSLPSGLGAALLQVVTSEFLVNWPDIHLDIHFADGDVDTIGSGYDLVLELSSSVPDSSLVSKSLGRYRRVLAASPAYIESKGAPDTLEELKYHRCVEISPPRSRERGWKFRTAEGMVTPACDFSLEVNNSLALVMAAKLGQGIIYVPEIYIADGLACGELVRVLDSAFEPQQASVFAIYANRNLPFKVRLLMEVLENAVARVTAMAAVAEATH